MTDDAPVFQAAIAHFCALPFGGNIDVPNGAYAIASEIDQPCSNVHLVGPGTGAFSHDTQQSTKFTDRGATFKWIGPGGGTILRVGPASTSDVFASSTRQGVTNADVTGIQFDGNHGLAAHGLVVQSVRWSHIWGQSQQTTDAGLLMTTATGLRDTNDTQQNDVDWEFNNFETQGVGVKCTATARVALPTGEPMGNCSNNHFRNVVGTVNAATGLDFGASDHNVVDNAGCLNASGTHADSDGVRHFNTPCVVFEGGPNKGDIAYANTIHLASGGDVVSQGTNIIGVVGPALYNRIDQLDPVDYGNAVIGPGSIMSWQTDQAEWHGKTAYFSTPLAAASGGTGNAGAFTGYTTTTGHVGGAGVAVSQTRADYRLDGKLLHINVGLYVTYSTIPDGLTFTLPAGLTTSDSASVHGVTLEAGIGIHGQVRGSGNTLTVLSDAGGRPVTASGQHLSLQGELEVR